jgi:hypothetical protein
MVLFSLLVAIPGNTCQSLSIPGNTWQYQVTPNNTFTILNNTKQYLTNLVLAGINNTSSIIANMIQVSPWYHHNIVLMVLCLSGIITLLILAIFRKTFEAYFY